MLTPPFFRRCVESPRAIVMILGPLGVSNSSLQIMADLHPQCCVVAACSPPLRFVLNKSLQSTVHSILHSAQELCSKHPGVPIVSHAFSNGGAFLLDSIEETINRETYNSHDVNNEETSWDRAELLERFRAGVQIFDSCPCYIRLAWDWEHFGDSFPHPHLSKTKRLIYATGATLSLTAWSISTFSVSYPKLFWKNMLKSRTCMHQIYVYSRCDLLSDAAAIERLVNYRRSVMGANCAVFAFDDSDHCKLHLDHRDTYVKVIEDAMTAMQERSQNSCASKSD